MKIGEYSLGTLIMFAAIVFVFLLPVFKMIRMFRKKKKERQITADATVIDMQSREALQPLQDGALDDVTAAADDAEETETSSAEEAPRKAKRPVRRRKRLPEREYFAAFRLADGERLEIELPGGVYKRLSIGDTGFITYTDTEFVTFRWTHSEGPRLLWEKLLTKIKERKAADKKAVEPSTMEAAVHSQEDAPETTEAASESAAQEAEEGETTPVGV